MKAAIYMRPEEIVRRFTRMMEGDGVYRITVLAELNDCEPEDIAELLTMAGVDITGMEDMVSAIDPEQAQVMLADGCSLRDIGARFKVSAATVYRWLDAQGFGNRPKRARATMADVDEARARDLYRDGATDAEAARVFGVTASLMSKWRYKHDVHTARSQKQAQAYAKTAPAAEAAEIAVGEACTVEVAAGVVTC